MLIYDKIEIGVKYMIQGELLKKYREQNNLTIKDLSKLMHVSKNVISLWEDGTKIPREDDIIFLCSLYGIDRIDIMKSEKKVRTSKFKLNDKRYRNILVTIVLLIFSIVLGIILKSILVSVILSFSIITVYNSLYYIKDERDFSSHQKGPKSLLGITLKNKEKGELVKYYSIESITVASLYLLLSLIAYELNVEPLIIKVVIFESEIPNMLFIWGSLFILLSGLILIVEIIFGSILLKKEG